MEDATTAKPSDARGAERKPSAHSAPSIALPKGGGALRSIDEKFSVNSSNGTCRLSVALPLSKTRSALGAGLELNYDSGGGNGAFGLGWNLNLPSIQRRTEKRLPRYQDADESDVFVFSGADDLVPAHQLDGSGSWVPDAPPAQPGIAVRRYRPRIEGMFSRIERIFIDGEAGPFWKVTSRDNVTTLFGRTAAARIADPANPGRIFRWLPEWAYDDRGNCVEYLYKAEDSVNVPELLEENSRLSGRSPITNLYLKRFRYGNQQPYYADPPYALNPAAPAAPGYLFDAVFDYGEHDTAAPSVDASGTWPCRFDPFSDYRSGFEIRSYRLCRRILFFHTFQELDYSPAPYLVCSLDLAYANFPFTIGPRASCEVDFITSIQRTHYRKTGPTAYDQKSFPSLDLTYQPLNWDRTVRNVSSDNSIGAPRGATGPYQWLDFDGFGAPGLLTEQGDCWYFKENLGDGAFRPASEVFEKPALLGVAAGDLQFQDLDADGGKQLVSLVAEPRGYFDLDDDNHWLPYRRFEQMANVDVRDPNLRQLDLDGDGAPDLLFSEESALRWYRSLGRRGHEEALRLEKPYDEEAGPAVWFGDGTQTILTADMTGDRLHDIVRVRNGEVCYWPNLGYGRFGAKVAMRNAPVFDRPDQFDPALVQFGDISGTGAADLIYLGRGGFTAWINLAGNAWSDPQPISPFPSTESPNRVGVLDLLGNGTACLVWSSELPANASSPMRYVDLMGGKKPYLLSGYKNNLGASISLEYSSSTHFALLDKREGRPWVTKLPFPVMCVSRWQTDEQISGAHLVHEYRYRHGYYDHAEREFRGFGMVEERDSESFDRYRSAGGNTAIDMQVFQAPVRTRTWFHTGAYVRGAHILQQFATDYYNGLVPEHALPVAVIDAPGATPDELRQAARCCKGLMLRQEVYADDGTPNAHVPYSTVTRNCGVRLLQPNLTNPYAVFLSHTSETVTYRYERNENDPRINHELDIVLDEFANVLESARVVYGRQQADPSLPADVQLEQGRLRATYTVNAFTNDVLIPTAYRPRLQCRTQDFELSGVKPAAGFFTLQEIQTQFYGASPLKYEQLTHPGVLEKRPYREHRTLYAADGNPNQPLPLGTLGSLGLAYETYGLAFTPGLITGLYRSQLTNAMLSEGGYLSGDVTVGAGLFPSSDAAGLWWSRAGTVKYPVNPAQHFYLPTQFLDAFGNVTAAHYYGNYHLLIDRVTNAVGNDTVVQAFDWRCLVPQRIQDINNNLTAVGLDILGLTVGMALQGKGAQADDLSGFQADLTQPQIASFRADPLNGGAGLIADATTRFVYDFTTLPALSATIRRETHATEAAATGVPSKLQYTFEYSDGLGRLAMTKIQTEPGLAQQCAVMPDGTFTIADVDTSPNRRWIGTGRQVRNNKGNAVIQYEPYFSTTWGFETAAQLVEQGVSPVLQYDPLDRLVRTDFPDGSFDTVQFDAWSQSSFDRNDNVLASVWYAARIGGALGTAEQAAAQRTATHDNTPTRTSLDSLARNVFELTDNRFIDRLTNVPKEIFYQTRTAFDIGGNRLSVRDPRGNTVMTYAYDLLSRVTSSTSMDAGQRLFLPDTTGAAMYVWDALGNRLRTQYDALRRPTQREVLTPASSLVVFEKSTYGTNPATNQNGKLILQYDPSGKVTRDLYDFKGNLLSATRTFTVEHAADINWTNPAAIPLEPTVYATSESYDALNRATLSTTPDGSVRKLGYSESGLLTSVSISVQGGASQGLIDAVGHDEKLRRESITYSNGAISTFDYDALTFRLRRVRTSLNGSLQDLNYTYDPVGNVTQIRDAAQQTVYFNGQIVNAQADYTYDALYRLISATGREHIGQNAPVSAFDEFRTNLAQPGNAAMMRRYLQQYDYDGAGSLLNMVHSSGTGPFVNQWTRQFAPAPTSNQLLSSQVGGATENYAYDPQGNLISLPGKPTITWDYSNLLRSADLGGGGTVYYSYDASGTRVRKVVERRGGSIEQRLYVGNYELYSQTQGGAPVLARETLRIPDGGANLALIDTLAQGPGAPSSLVRYQFSNHLQSSLLELDVNGLIISYEEYYPYGSTSFQSVDSSRQVPAKRYRYTGKERDEETGFQYHGARYYAPWLARWMSCDPKGIADGNNCYGYVHGNPIRHSDPSGTEGEDKTDKKTKKADDDSDDESKQPIGGWTPGSDFFPPPHLELKPPNFWYSSYSQGLGIMEQEGFWDVEANLYLTYMRMQGWGGQPSANAGGLQTAQLSMRRQVPGAPGFDLGFGVGGSYLTQGTITGDVPSRGVSGFLTAHYAKKGESGWGGGGYLQVGGAAQRSGSGRWIGTPTASLTPVIAWEPENSKINSVAINVATASYVSQGQLTQGPLLRNLFTIGANVGVGINVIPDKLVLTPEVSWIHSQGFSGPTPQSAWSETLRAGIAATISYRGTGSAGAQQNSVSVGLWYAFERGTVSQSKDAPSGSFWTHSVMTGATFGMERPFLGLF